MCGKQLWIEYMNFWRSQKFRSKNFSDSTFQQTSKFGGRRYYGRETVLEFVHLGRHLEEIKKYNVLNGWWNCSFMSSLAKSIFGVKHISFPVSKGEKGQNGMNIGWTMHEQGLRCYSRESTLGDNLEVPSKTLSKRSAHEGDYKVSTPKQGGPLHDQHAYQSSGWNIAYTAVRQICDIKTDFISFSNLYIR